MEKSALIIGITGGFGGAVASALNRNGWQIRALTRNPERAKIDFPQYGHVEWIRGDAMLENDVLKAAKGANLIVHGANPPGYKNWRGLAIPMLENSISASIKHGSRLVFPGNVYNFGPDAFPSIEENSPQNPHTEKGKIRVEMENSLRESTAKGARVLIVRAGDFFGPHAPGSWFSNALVKPGTIVKKVIYPGDPDVGHTWAYLPDLGQTVAELCAKEESLSPFEVFNFGGHQLESSRDMVGAIARATGIKELPLKRFPWILISILSPFVGMFKEILEMRYLWKEPVRLNNDKLVRLLGREPRTPLDKAVEITLQGMKCLPGKTEKFGVEIGQTA